MAPWLWGVILFIVFVIGGMAAILWRAREIKKSVTGMVYVTVLKHNGSSDDMLLPSDGLTMDIPKAGKKKGAIALDTQATFDMKYPPTEKGILPGFIRDIMCTTVRRVVMAEGYGHPWAPFAEKPVWTDDKMQAIKSEAATKDIIERGYQKFGGAAIGKFPIKPVYMYVAFGLLLLLVGVSAFMAYMGWAAASSVAGVYGL